VLEDVSDLQTVEVPLPIAKPKPPKKPEPKKQEIVKKQEPKKKEPPKQQSQKVQPESKAAVKAKAQVKQSNKTAAKQNASGRSNAQAEAKWHSRLKAHLDRHKKKMDSEEGKAFVRFEVDDAGKVLSVALVRSSGSPVLDKLAVDMVRNASPVPAPPPGANKKITVPIQWHHGR